MKTIRDMAILAASIVVVVVMLAIGDDEQKDRQAKCP